MAHRMAAPVLPVLLLAAAALLAAGASAARSPSGAAAAAADVGTMHAPSSAAGATEPRLVEWPLTLPGGGAGAASAGDGVGAATAGDGVPIIDPPRHSAGYFRLARTEDARMFYFLFRARTPDWQSAPLVLWMTGACAPVAPPPLQPLLPPLATRSALLGATRTGGPPSCMQRR